MTTLVWKGGYDGYFAWTERYEYSFGGEGIGGLGPAWLSIGIKRKSDGKRFDKEWFKKVARLDSSESIETLVAECERLTRWARRFCQGFEDGYVVVFPWEWKG